MRNPPAEACSPSRPSPGLKNRELGDNPEEKAGAETSDIPSQSDTCRTRNSLEFQVRQRQGGGEGERMARQEARDRTEAKLSMGQGQVLPHLQ